MVAVAVLHQISEIQQSGHQVGIILRAQVVSVNNISILLWLRICAADCNCVSVIVVFAVTLSVS